MRVLHVIPSVSTVHGGPSEAMKLFEQACIAAGQDIETATTDDDGPGKRNGLVNGAAVNIDGVVRHYFRKTTDTYKVSLPLFAWLWKNIDKYDVIHLHALFSFSSTAAGLIARYKKVPYIIRPLGTLNKYGLEKRRAFAKRLSMFFIENALLKHASCVHCTSEREKADVEELEPGLMIRVLPLSASPTLAIDRNVAIQHLPALADKRWLIFMSRLDPVKNIELLFQAFERSLKTLPEDVVLLVAGDGQDAYRRSLIELARKLGIDTRVVWAGHLQGNVKASALGGAELFILPSQSENFGMAAAEAMLAGVPCALSEGVAIAEAAAGAGAAMILGNDVDKMAAQIVNVVGDVGLRHSLSVNAVKFAQTHYSVEQMGENLKQLYNDVVNLAKGVKAGS